MEELSVSTCLAILRRWKMIFLAVWFVLLVGSLTFAMHWSNYRSTAMVEIEQPEVSAAATSTVNESLLSVADKRISIIQQKVLSTASLVEIITKFNLYADMRKSVPIADIAEKMRPKINLDLIANARTAGGRSSTIAFTLSFDYKEPLAAQQVVDELVTRFLNEDIKERRTEVQQTSAFLDAQLEALGKSLSEQEANLADYQKKHGISRAENLGFNQGLVVSLTFSLQNMDTQISTAMGNLASLQTQLAGISPYLEGSTSGKASSAPSTLAALQSEYSALTAQYGPEHPDVVRVRNQIEALQSRADDTSLKPEQIKTQIADTRADLDKAKKTYGPEHPDVVTLQEKLKKLEGQMNSQKQSQAKNSFGIVANANNPAYLQVAAQIQTASEQYKALVKNRAELQQQLESFNKALNDNPEAQQELMALTRDYDNVKSRYKEIKEKKLIADMKEQMEKERIGERLSLINPPQYPSQTQPRRIFLILGGICASIIGGLVSVVAAQIASQSIISAHYLEVVVGAAPLVSIPRIYTREDVHYSLHRRLWRALCSLFKLVFGRAFPHLFGRLTSSFKRLVARDKSQPK
ncbi:MAG: hypothetical protein WC464_04915 [Bdellovibrionales bacterium]